MTTFVGTQKDLVTLIMKLIALDYDAIEAYKTAIAKIHGADAKAHLTSFMHDHERHVKDLTAELEALGMPAPRGPDAKGMLTTGKVYVASLIGDRAILMAMKTNEDDTNRAYERACKRDDLTESLRLIFTKNLDDERRHRLWIEAQLHHRRAVAEVHRP